MVALLRYVALAFYDLVVNGLQVARLVIDPRVPVRPGILAIPTETVSDLGTALSAHAITLAPGELVLEIDEEGVMYTHVLDAADADAHLREAQRLRRDLLSRILS
jgi:multicomponent Na+:H+ antiporter subunit E